MHVGQQYNVSSICQQLHVCENMTNYIIRVYNVILRLDWGGLSSYIWNRLSECRHILALYVSTGSGAHMLATYSTDITLKVHVHNPKLETYLAYLALTNENVINVGL